MRLITSFFVMLLILTPAVYAGEAKPHTMHSGQTISDALTEAGNDAFGTIQEVIRKLNHDPKLDWSKVDLEVLRQHLVDMNDMTLNVEVLSQKAVDKGLQVLLRPTTPRAESALDRVFSVHPAQLKEEKGWQMRVQKKEKIYTLRISTEKPEELHQMRGLGYIGIMASGDHHQTHHMMMAKGENPHHDH